MEILTSLTKWLQTFFQREERMMNGFKSFWLKIQLPKKNLLTMQNELLISAYWTDFIDSLMTLLHMQTWETDWKDIRRQTTIEQKMMNSKKLSENSWKFTEILSFHNFVKIKSISFELKKSIIKREEAQMTMQIFLWKKRSFNSSKNRNLLRQN